jgi:hypothetical protein
MTDASLTLSQLPDLLRQLDPPVSAKALALVDEEHASWRGLHDRLIALLAAFVDDAVEAGRPLQEVLEGAAARTSMGVDELVGTRVDARAIASLLRAHGSLGDVQVTEDATTFRHDCGTGLALWRKNPELATVQEGEVDGVPSGRPRYCARCMHTISAYGEAWVVAPPASPADRCTWTIPDR